MPKGTRCRFRSRHSSFGIVWVWAALLSSSVPTAAADRLLVMPLENIGREPSIYWLPEASAIVLADDLNALGASAIARAERIRALEQLHLPPSAALSRATVIKVGQLAGAAEVVVGTVEREAGDLVVRARTIRIDTGRLNPEIVERGALTDLFTIFERVARRLLGRGAGGAPLDNRPPLEAFESYVKGLVAESAEAQARFLEEALARHPSYDRARLALWEVRTGQGQDERALEAVRGVDARSRFARRARFMAALSQLDLGRHAEAFAGFKALDAEQPAPELKNNLGVVQLRRGPTPETGRATWHFTQAADADPGNPDYCFNIGYAYMLENDMPAAVYWLREAVRRNPADGDAHFVLAAALKAQGSDVEAARERELALQLSSKYAKSTVVPRGMERVKTAIGLPDALSIDASIAMPAQRDQRELADFHLDRGRRLFDDERDRDALAELRRALYLSPYEAEAHLLVGSIHLRNGRAREAIDALKISIWSEETVAARIALGEAYLKTGDQPAARAQLERALALAPESAEARRLLGQIR
jgi:tetratricopeptide (TPR) repeat protein